MEWNTPIQEILSREMLPARPDLTWTYLLQAEQAGRGKQVAQPGWPMYRRGSGGKVGGRL